MASVDDTTTLTMDNAQPVVLWLARRGVLGNLGPPMDRSVIVVPDAGGPRQVIWPGDTIKVERGRVVIVSSEGKGRR